MCDVWCRYAIVIIHEDHLHANDTSWEPCIKNVYDFTSAILFSIETQATIGYGLRVPDNKCSEVKVTRVRVRVGFRFGMRIEVRVGIK